MELIGSAYLKMKTERAKVHLDAFNRELDLFLKEPYAVTGKDDIQNGRYIRRTEVKPNDPVIAMLLGEFLYCLRSGLDQMVWQLALASARNDPRQSGNICFPIYEKLASNDARRNYRKVLKLFPDAVANEIDSVQPHKAPGSPKDHPLWQLNKLCNLDKHCFIPVHSRTAGFFVPVTNPPAEIRYFPLEHAMEVSVLIKDKHQFDFAPEAPSKIELGEWESDWAIPISRLGDIYSFIADTVLPKFKQFRFGATSGANIRVFGSKPLYKWN